MPYEKKFLSRKSKKKKWPYCENGKGRFQISKKSYLAGNFHDSFTGDAVGPIGDTNFRRKKSIKERERERETVYVWERES